MQSFPFSECLSFCMSKDDSRWNEMCSHPLNPSGSTCQDKLLGMEECKSPFGIYELKIPVNEDLACENTGITDKNCKDLDVRNPITRSFEFEKSLVTFSQLFIPFTDFYECLIFLSRFSRLFKYGHSVDLPFYCELYQK